MLCLASAGASGGDIFAKKKVRLFFLG